MVLPVIGAAVVKVLFGIGALGPIAGGLFAVLQPFIAPGLLAGIQSVAMGGSPALAGVLGGSFLSLFGLTGWYLKQFSSPNPDILFVPGDQFKSTCKFCSCDIVPNLENSDQTWVFCRYKPNWNIVMKMVMKRRFPPHPAHQLLASSWIGSFVSWSTPCTLLRNTVWMCLDGLDLHWRVSFPIVN